MLLFDGGMHKVYRYAFNSFLTMDQFFAAPGVGDKEEDGVAARDAGRDIQEHPIALSTLNQPKNFFSPPMSYAN